MIDSKGECPPFLHTYILLCLFIILVKRNKVAKGIKFIQPAISRKLQVKDRLAYTGNVPRSETPLLLQDTEARPEPV